MSAPLSHFVPGRSLPRSTYRVQLNREFTFAHAARIVPYLSRLGISHLYTSPILKARTGSMHGYDVVDHTVLNPEIGSSEDFDALVETLHAHGMGLIVDIVPNHLGIMGNDNEWWLDLLENGPAANAALYFDIDWRPNRASLRNRVLVPILGGPFGSVIERGELKVEYIAARGAFLVRYFEHSFPLDPREYPRIFVDIFDDDSWPPDDPDRADFESLMTAFANLPARHEDSAESRAIRYRDKEAHKRRLLRLVERSPQVLTLIDRAIQRINGTVGEPRSFDALDSLLDAQAYRLAYWRVAVDEINYRRFFDVNDLAALRMNEPTVFEQTHALIFKLIEAGKIDGLRIDHSDGLFDPHRYFEQLQARFGADDANPKPLYVITEKILATHERLPTQWPVHGTTGYDFVALATGWLVDADQEEALTRLYRSFTGVSDPFDELAYQAKRLVMRTSLAAEVEVLATQLDRIAQLDRHTADFTRAAMREAIVETIARFPVYRTYVSERSVSDEDRRIVQWAINVARANGSGGELLIYDFLRDVLLAETAIDRSESQQRAIREFAMKFQQVTAPVTAKGIEDTAFYRYHRLICVNEVGGDPRRLAFSTAAVHQENLERAKFWPHAMVASSTHDTKRSEDARARIAVLSELPDLWRHHVTRWSRINRGKRRQLENGHAPSRNDEYLLYQTLIGVWSPHETNESLVPRLQAYMTKATREAKRATSWMNPNAEYEDGIGAFIAQLFDKPEQSAFLRDFATLAQTTTFFGHLNSLALTVLKHTSPGVPDTYQGTEILSLSLVDPDNRRPVDYESLTKQLDEIESSVQAKQHMTSISAAFGAPDSNAAKLFVTWQLLQLRKQHDAVFTAGDYEPLQVSGELKTHVLAFSRSAGNTRVIVVIANLMAKLMRGERQLPIAEVWTDAAIALPQVPRGPLRELFTGRAMTLGDGGALRVADVLHALPIAVLIDTDT